MSKPSQPLMLQCPHALVQGCSRTLVALQSAYPNDCRYAPRHGQEAGLHLQQQRRVKLPLTALQRAADEPIECKLQMRQGCLQWMSMPWCKSALCEGAGPRFQCLCPFLTSCSFWGSCS